MKKQWVEEKEGMEQREEQLLEQRECLEGHHFPFTLGSVEILMSLEASTGQQRPNLLICKTNLDMATH